MQWRSVAIILVGAAVAIVLSAIPSPFWGTTEVAHYTARLHLKLTVSSIYEYHAKMRQWPTRIDDLALTSLPIVSQHWREFLDDEVIVIVWHKALKPDPKDNADRILAYYEKGRISKRGHKWVCWGDLRMEYIKTEELYSYLNKRAD